MMSNWPPYSEANKADKAFSSALSGDEFGLYAADVGIVEKA